MILIRQSSSRVRFGQRERRQWRRLPGYVYVYVWWVAGEGLEGEWGG